MHTVDDRQVWRLMALAGIGGTDSDQASPQP
jgi:hypothetical protein